MTESDFRTQMQRIAFETQIGFKVGLLMFDRWTEISYITVFCVRSGVILKVLLIFYYFLYFELYFKLLVTLSNPNNTYIQLNVK